MKKIMASFLAVILAASLTVGCGSSVAPKPDAAQEKADTAEATAQEKEGGAEAEAEAAVQEMEGSAEAEAAAATQEKEGSAEAAAAAQEKEGGAEAEAEANTAEAAPAEAESDGEGAQEKSKPGDLLTGEGGEETGEGSDGGLSVGTAGTEGDTVLEDVSFVMIYNPRIYDEVDSQTTYYTSLDTGDLSTQIITGIKRAGGLEEEFMPKTMSQAELTKDLDTEGIEKSGAKAGGLDPVYSKGDVHDFFCCDMRMNRVLKRFVCIYEGESCYIWTYNNSVTEKDAERLGKEFDETIYPQDVEAFGYGRFTENGGKVNILMYPLRQGLCGFFHLYDIFSGSEVPPFMVNSRGFNTDHAIININSSMLKNYWDLMLSTLAHEFQHQICASDCFNYVDTPWMRTWLNEAMSAYAEDMIYPNVMDDEYYNQALYVSNSYRTGQSLYDFGTTNDDIGAYGAVCLLERYLTRETDDEIFRRIHEFWRNSYRDDITEAEALYLSVTDEFRDRIGQKYDYPDSVSEIFTGDEEEWMSKMTLDYHLETLWMDLAHLKGSEDIARRYMLYTEVNAQKIEGGGRMLVATANGSYAIPGDADEGLIYIGLDDDFNVVTGLITEE